VSPLEQITTVTRTKKQKQADKQVLRLNSIISPNKSEQNQSEQVNIIRTKSIWTSHVDIIRKKKSHENKSKKQVTSKTNQFGICNWPSNYNWKRHLAKEKKRRKSWYFAICTHGTRTCYHNMHNTSHCLCFKLLWYFLLVPWCGSLFVQIKWI